MRPTLAMANSFRKIIPVVLAALALGCGREEIEVYFEPPMPPRVVAPDHWEEVSRAAISEDIGQSLYRMGIGEGHPSYSGMRMKFLEDIKQRFRMEHPLADADANGTAIATATLTVLPFDSNQPEGLARTRQMNLNRWRREVSLSSLEAEADIAAALKPVPGLEGEARLMDMAGESSREPGKPLRTVGVLVPFKRALWVYKLTGHPEAVEKERAAFIALLPKWQ